MFKTLEENDKRCETQVEAFKQEIVQKLSSVHSLLTEQATENFQSLLAQVKTTTE